MTKIKVNLSSDAGVYLLFGIPLTILAVYEIVTTGFHNLNINNLLFDVLMLIAGLMSILGSIVGTYFISTDTELMRSELFWRTRYRYERVTRIFFMRHWFLGDILVIEYRTKSGTNKTERLLPISAYDPVDLHRLLESIKNNGKNIEFDDYCSRLAL